MPVLLDLSPEHICSPESQPPSPRSAIHLARNQYHLGGRVRSLDITLTGYFDDRLPSVLALFELFPQLLNVTHAYVRCVDSRNDWDLATSPRLIEVAVQRLPSLLSLSVDCCTDWMGLGFLDMADRPVPELRHLASRFCHPNGLCNPWNYCLNLEVIEIEAGRAEEFWQKNTNSLHEFEGDKLYDTGLSFIMEESRDRVQRPSFFDSDRKIHLISDAPSDDGAV
ncbi:hypothetical protein C8R46DRAFT_1213384 [Mycena filopes]|nr:hypothetical protein C8R46DRAFT_1213384 [Mycena filopes]